MGAPTELATTAGERGLLSRTTTKFLERLARCLACGLLQLITANVIIPGLLGILYFLVIFTVIIIIVITIITITSGAATTLAA